MRAESCPTLCDPMDCNVPDSSVQGILQVRILQPCPPPGDLPNPGIQPPSLISPVLADGFFTTGATWEAHKTALKFTNLLATTWEWRTHLFDILGVLMSYLEKEMATHSSILAWRIPWREEPGRLQSTGSQRVGHD